MRDAFTKVWPGGEHPFRLQIGELRAIEQRSDAGVAVVLMRLMASTWKIDDVIGPIRLGLVGGGMPERDAQRLVDQVLADGASLYSLALPAADILREFIMWDGDDQPGEARAGTAMAAPRSPTEEPDGPATTDPAP